MIENLTLKELEGLSKSELIAMIKMLWASLEEANAFVDSLKKTIEAQNDDILNATYTINEVRRQIGLRNKALFGSTSEKTKRESKAPKAAAPENKIENHEQAAASEGNNGTRDLINSAAAAVGNKRRYKNGHPGRGTIPDGLPVEETHHYPKGYDENSPRQLEPEVTERIFLRIIVGVKRDIRHKFATPEGGFAIPPMTLDNPFHKYKADCELVCNMMTLRFFLHMPYYRFHQMLHGCNQSYSTLMGWAARFFDIIQVLSPILEKAILENARLLAMDETIFKVLDSPKKIAAFRAELQAKGVALEKLKLETVGKDKAKEQNTLDNQSNTTSDVEEVDLLSDNVTGSTKNKVIITGYVWAMVNPLAKLAMYKYSPSRCSINPKLMLEGVKEPLNLLTDAYAGYNAVVEDSNGRIEHSKCWSHARREIRDACPATGSDYILERIKKLIDWLFKIERDNKGLSAEDLMTVRQKRSNRILAMIKNYIESKITCYAPKEAPRKAMQYILNNWKELAAYPNILHSKIDNNISERCVKSIVIGRKNILFLGSVAHSSGAMLLYSLTECCRMNNINPGKWINDIIPRITQIKDAPEKLMELLPHKWRPVTEEIMQT